MNTESRPSPLDDLENELRRASRAAPPVTLRARVIGAVRVELRRRRVRDWVLTVAATAALAVLWLNLSWSASHRMGEVRPARAEVPSLASIAREIQRILPQTTRNQALSYAFILRSAASLDRCPEARSPQLRWRGLDLIEGRPN